MFNQSKPEFFLTIILNVKQFIHNSKFCFHIFSKTNKNLKTPPMLLFFERAPPNINKSCTLFTSSQASTEHVYVSPRKNTKSLVLVNLEFVASICEKYRFQGQCFNMAEKKRCIFPRKVLLKATCSLKTNETKPKFWLCLCFLFFLDLIIFE